MKLDEIADISTGLVLARKKSSTNKGFKYELLTLKSFSENGYLEDDYLDNFTSEEKIKSKYLTQEGDIIVRLSSPNTAIYITKDQENIVIPSLFAIIRNRSKTINFRFIQVYLNSEKCKRRLAADTIGSAVPIVRTSSFKDIKIPEYTLENQNKVIELNKLVIKEKQILEQFIDEKNKYHKTIMSKMFK
ncbi:restriction endonuclease subunit S [Clostridioides sp. ES-S-0190-01]|uniref:restriction endonuclease subunit S n=1 Tax=Clostridioides sp. ES-S-0190-01 TaxID=2770787 RepID=UPI001D112FCF|nr:restriction endonuclease subunit S [Clostridioides sp. ES-S-0190-01]